MKKNIVIVLTLAIVLVICSHCLALDIEASSRIAEVTVHPDSALVSRIANIKLNAGIHKIVFPDIIPEIDENSLRVQIKGNLGVKLLDAKINREFLEDVPAKEAKQLKEEIQKLEDEVKTLQNHKALYLEEKGFLDSIRLFSSGQIPKDLVTKMPASGDLDNTLKFLDTKLKENYANIFDCEIKIRELTKNLAALKNRLSQVSGSMQKIKRSIIVDIEAEKQTEVNLVVSYLVRGAFWYPIYDARSNFEESKVELVSYGIVTQSTGEDWVSVEMSLSTAKPTIGGSMPYVSPWFLKPYEQRIMLMEKSKKSVRLASQFEAFDSLEQEIAKEEAKAPVYAEAKERGTAVVYKLPQKTTVKADGSESKLAISSQVLNAKFEYSTYPRLSLCAYLGSRVRNSPILQLLAGRVNIFLEGDFVGSSNIKDIGPGEEFDLYLGADENVKVKRELIEKKVDETLAMGIPSPNKQTTFKYKLTLENYKSKKITAKLFEAIPVSQDDRIKVKIIDVSLQPKEKDWKDRKGVWLWELELEPKAKKEIFYTFNVEHPRDMQVEGL